MTNRPLKIPGRRLVITKRLLESSHENTKSAAEAARWLGVSFNTYKKWAKYYGVFDKHINQSGKGIKRSRVDTKYNLDDVLNGKYPDYPTRIYKKRLIDNSYIKEECSVCGWNEERLTDNKICLSLDYIDGDEKNKEYSNLRLLCPNCYFTNVGEFLNSKKFC